MTETSILNDEIQALIDSHIDQVDVALVEAGHTRSDRMTICDNLQEQIVEMLECRDETPTAEDVRAILYELDDPNSFGDAHRPSPCPDNPRTLPLSITAACVAVLGVVVGLIYAEWRGHESDRQQAAVICFLITSLSLLMGVTAIRQIRQSPRTTRGYLLAYIGVICLPICVSLWINREFAYPLNTRLAREIHDYNDSRRIVFRTSQGEIVRSDGSLLPSESDTIIKPAADVPAAPPTIPFVTTRRGWFLFSLLTCFGPTVLLSAIFVPYFYRRFYPSKQLQC